MNPNANSFQGFRPGAASFAPGGGGQGQNQQGQGQQQHPYGQYGGFDAGAGYGGYGQYAGGQGGYGQQQGGGGGAYGGGQYGYGGAGQGYYQQQGGYGGYYGGGGYQQPHQQYSQAPPAAGGAPPESWDDDSSPASSSRPTPAPTPAQMPSERPKPAAGSGSVDKPAVMSLSIGGSKKPAAAAAGKAAASDKAASNPTSRSQTPAPAADKTATSGTTTPTKKAAAAAASAAAGPATGAPAAGSKGTTPEKAVASSAAPAAGAGKTVTLGDQPIKRHVKDSDAVKSEVEGAVDAETLQDLYKPSAKEEEEMLAENGKSHVNIVFIGHVDAGKSTMGGQILFLSGMVDQRTMEKYEREAKEAGRESWYLSWALDSTQQERAKGKTVEVGRAYFETAQRRYTILDAPGHKTYVPAMISGAAQADVAVLVISARKGEFETGFERGGQTREHAMLVKTAGVGKLVVVVNKMDDSTVEWSNERWEEVKGKLGPFLKSAGFSLKTDVTWVPVSAYTGANVKDRVPKSVCKWYEGPSLLEHLDTMPLADRKIHAPLMVPISEKYKDLGTMIVGKIESGRVAKGDTVLMMPNRVTVEVSAIYNEMEEEVSRALCGDNVRMRIKGIEDEDVTVGFVLSDKNHPVSAVTRFEAQIAILDSKNIICAGYGAVMHVHTLSEEVTLSALLHYYDKKTGKKSRRPPQFAKKGMKIVALIETTAPVCIEPFKSYPQLGRFTLRDEGKTVGIGKVTKLIKDAEADLSDMAKLTLASAAANGTA